MVMAVMASGLHLSNIVEGLVHKSNDFMYAMFSVFLVATVAVIMSG